MENKPYNQGLSNLLAEVKCLALDDAVEQKTIELRKQHKIKLPDAIVLATAQVHSLQLLTLDNKLKRFFESYI